MDLWGYLAPDGVCAVNIRGKPKNDTGGPGTSEERIKNVAYAIKMLSHEELQTIGKDLDDSKQNMAAALTSWASEQFEPGEH